MKSAINSFWLTLALLSFNAAMAGVADWEWEGGVGPPTRFLAAPVVLGEHQPTASSLIDSIDAVAEKCEHFWMDEDRAFHSECLFYAEATGSVLTVFIRLQWITKRNIVAITVEFEGRESKSPDEANVVLRILGVSLD